MTKGPCRITRPFSAKLFELEKIRDKLTKERKRRKSAESCLEEAEEVIRFSPHVDNEDLKMLSEIEAHFDKYGD